VTVYNVDENYNTCSINSSEYLFYVSFAGLGLGLGLVTAGLDHNTVGRRAVLETAGLLALICSFRSASLPAR